MIDIPGLIRTLGAKGVSYHDIADAVEALLGPIPVYDMDQKLADKRRKAAARQAAKRARDEAARERDSSRVTERDSSVTHSENVTQSHADKSVTQSVTPSRVSAQVVLLPLPSEEILTPSTTPTGSSSPNPKSRKSKGPKSRRCPEDWEPNDGHRGLVAELRMPQERARMALAKFRDHEFKTPHSDWDAAFRNWLRNDADRIGNGTTGTGHSDRHLGKLGAMARGAQAALDRGGGRWGGL